MDGIQLSEADRAQLQTLWLQLRLLAFSTAAERELDDYHNGALRDQKFASRLRQETDCFGLHREHIGRASELLSDMSVRLGRLLGLED